MPQHEITLLGSMDVALGTRAFRFAKPAGFSFSPGQYADFSLIDPPETDDAGTLRSFSLASAPHEGELMIATRMRDSAFKRTLGALPAGSRIALDGPHGELLLEDEARPLVLLAGGIGITPFLSMLRHAAQAGNADRDITLVYGNRTSEAAAFRHELAGLATRLPRLRIVDVMSEPQACVEPWRGESGFIDENLVTRHVLDLGAPLWYAVGPPAMTAAMRDVLMNVGIEDDAVRVEDFAGY